MPESYILLLLHDEGEMYLLTVAGDQKVKVEELETLEELKKPLIELCTESLTEIFLGQSLISVDEAADESLFCMLVTG